MLLPTSSAPTGSTPWTTTWRSAHILFGCWPKGMDIGERLDTAPRYLAGLGVSLQSRHLKPWCPRREAESIVKCHLGGSGAPPGACMEEDAARPSSSMVLEARGLDPSRRGSGENMRERQQGGPAPLRGYDRQKAGLRRLLRASARGTACVRARSRQVRPLFHRGSSAWTPEASRFKPSDRIGAPAQRGTMRGVGLVGFRDWCGGGKTGLQRLFKDLVWERDVPRPQTPPQVRVVVRIPLVYPPQVDELRAEAQAATREGHLLADTGEPQALQEAGYRHGASRKSAATLAACSSPRTQSTFALSTTTRARASSTTT